MDATHPKGPLIEAISVEVISAKSKHLLIEGVDWKVAAGEMWIVGGTHDAGKTDLLLTAAGLQRALAGCVRIFGRDVSELSEPQLLEQRARMGFVFKGGGRLFPDLTVAQNVALPLRYHRNWNPAQAENEVRAILEQTGLLDEADENPLDVGLGKQLRVGLARALVMKPDILFLDEPVEGLEPGQRRWWQDFLAGLMTGERPMTIIVSTNDFALWPGGRRQLALIKDKHWHVLGQQADSPQIG